MDGQREAGSLLLAVEDAHLGRTVAGAGHGVGGNGGFNDSKLVSGEFDGESGKALGQLSAGARAYDRNNEAAFSQHPCDGQLRRRNAFGEGDLLELRNQLAIARQVVACEARQARAEVA